MGLWDKLESGWEGFWEKGGNPLARVYQGVTGLGWKAPGPQAAVKWLGQWDEAPSIPPTKENLAIQQSMMPVASNPAIARWAQWAGNAGSNPAARAAAAQRQQTLGMAAMGRAAPGYWTRMMQMALERNREASQIPTTSWDAAALAGFTQGGGFQGLGSIFGAKK